MRKDVVGLARVHLRDPSREFVRNPVSQQVRRQPLPRVLLERRQDTAAGHRFVDVFVDVAEPGVQDSDDVGSIDLVLK